MLLQRWKWSHLYDDLNYLKDWAYDHSILALKVNCFPEYLQAKIFLLPFHSYRVIKSRFFKLDAVKAFGVLSVYCVNSYFCALVSSSSFRNAFYVLSIWKIATHLSRLSTQVTYRKTLTQSHMIANATELTLCYFSLFTT